MSAPFILIDLDLDRCSQSWQAAPCVALGATPCYRTRATCQDAANYAIETHAVRLCTAHQSVPPSIQAFPCVVNVEHVPTRISMKDGLGRRDQIVIECEDFQDGSELTDPYWSRRAARRSSSFFACLKRRNKHVAGRTLWVREAVLDEAGRVVESAMSARRYVIEKIDGPSNGRVQIVAKDVLWRLENAMVPAASVGELYADITDLSASLQVKSGQGAAYGTPPFTIRIDDEIMTVGARSGDTFSAIDRAQWGTTADSHDEDAKVQRCRTWTAQGPDAIWSDILDDAGVDAALIDAAGAATEAGVWYDAYSLEGCISEPTRAADLLAALMEQIGAFTWWDAEAQLVRFAGIHPLDPDETLASVDDVAHIEGRSITVKDKDEERISRIDFYYGVRDWSQSLDDGSNYRRRVLAIDASAETEAEYDEVRDTRTIFCYFLPVAMETYLEAMSGRVLERSRDASRYVTLDLTIDDATKAVGELLAITANELVDADGTPIATSCWALSKARASGDSLTFHYECLVDSDQTSARWAFVNYDACPAYDSATDEDKRCAFLADDTTETVGGDPPYCAI